MQAGSTLGEISDDEYHVVYLGRQSLHPGMYFYVAPARNPGVEAVYVDRVLLIREKGERRRRRGEADRVRGKPRPSGRGRIARTA